MVRSRRLCADDGASGGDLRSDGGRWRRSSIDQSCHHIHCFRPRRRRCHHRQRHHDRCHWRDGETAFTTSLPQPQALTPALTDPREESCAAAATTASATSLQGKGAPGTASALSAERLLMEEGSTGPGPSAAAQQQMDSSGSDRVQTPIGAVASAGTAESPSVTLADPDLTSSSGPWPSHTRLSDKSSSAAEIPAPTAELSPPSLLCRQLSPP